MSTGKGIRKVVIKNPVFLEYAALETRPHWKKFFTDFATSPPRKGLSYKDGAVYYKRPRKKTQVVCMLPADPVEAVETLKQFIVSQIGEFSVDELTKKRAELDIALSKNMMDPKMSWATIKAPTARKQLLAMFIFDLQEKYDLSDEEATNLHSIIADGLALKIITSDHIHIEDHRIVDIKGIHYDENGFSLEELETAEPPSPVRREPKARTKQINGALGWNMQRVAYARYMGIPVK
jgi:hypothetical protein